MQRGIQRLAGRRRSNPARSATVGDSKAQRTRSTAIVRPRRAGWLACQCSLAAVGVSAAPAQAITFSQQTLGFSGLNLPAGVAVDGSGDVFVARPRQQQGRGTGQRRAPPIGTQIRSPKESDTPLAEVLAPASSRCWLKQHPRTCSSSPCSTISSSTPRKPRLQTCGIPRCTRLAAESIFAASAFPTASGRQIGH
jgi:hypothetical protein